MAPCRGGIRGLTAPPIFNWPRSIWIWLKSILGRTTGPLRLVTDGRARFRSFSKKSTNREKWRRNIARQLPLCRPSVKGKLGNKGTVKWFNNQKAYGFIQVENGKEIFVHISAVERAGM